MFIVGEEEYNLITWSKDQNLRIWRVDSNIQKVIFVLCTYLWIRKLFLFRSYAVMNQIRIWQIFLKKLIPRSSNYQVSITVALTSSDQRPILSQHLKATENPSRNATDIQVGLEATEEAFGVLPSPEIISEKLCLPAHKGVAVSIAAAQAFLTNTLSPNSGRKRGGSTASLSSSSLVETKPLSENSYLFADEIEKLKEGEKCCRILPFI